MRNEKQLQQNYYTETAEEYERLHVHGSYDHNLAVSFLSGAVSYLNAKSVLDVGSGTGRVVSYLKKHSNVGVIGLEPVFALRQVGYRNGLTKTELIDGDATNLVYDDEAFDVVCAFGTLHHIKKPREAVKEMMRVARLAVFISDSNNFGQGSAFVRFAKQTANALRMWGAVNYMNTKGKGYHFSLGDGLFYSYSVFNDYDFIRGNCERVHVISLDGDGLNAYRSAGTVAILGVKKIAQCE